MLRDPNWGSVKRANASTIVDILAVPESQVRAAGRLDGPIRQSPRLPTPRSISPHTHLCPALLSL